MKKSIAAMIFCAALPICVENSRGMVPEEEGFDFYTAMGKFVDFSCDQVESTTVAQTWTVLISEFKSVDYGGRGCVDKNGVHTMHKILRDYFKYFQCDGFYDHLSTEQEVEEFKIKCPDLARGFGLLISSDPTKVRCYYTSADHEADGILTKYPNFAEAFGNTDDSSRPECYYVAAKNDGEDSSHRRKEDILNGIGEDFTLDCDGGVGNTRRINTILQLLLLTEIAESGTANKCNLDGCEEPLGYNFLIISKFCKLMSMFVE
jgi:hypothetical protein